MMRLRFGWLAGLTALAAACGSVSKSADDAGPGDDGGQCTSDQTVCSGECVDLAISHDNCGSCDNPCGTSQACIAKTCEDLDPLIDPTIETRWLDPTGWTDSNGDPIAATLSGDGDVPGAIYECRTGPTDTVGDLAFGPCDGADGTEPTYSPQVPDGKDEGFFKTQMRIRVGDYVSETVEFDYYIHHSLDGAELCDPGITDEQAITAATAALGALTDTFPAGTVTRNPFLNITFKTVTVDSSMLGGAPNKWGGVNGTDYTLVGNSLRRRLTLSPDNKLLLIRRQYVSRRAVAFGDDANKCKNGFVFGTRTGGNRASLDCAYLVLDAKGRGACVVNAGGNAVADVTSTHAFAKLAGRRAFSAKGPSDVCPANDFNPQACDWYLALPQ